MSLPDNQQIQNNHTITSPSSTNESKLRSVAVLDATCVHLQHMLEEQERGMKFFEEKIKDCVTKHHFDLLLSSKLSLTDLHDFLALFQAELDKMAKGKVEREEFDKAFEGKVNIGVMENMKRDLQSLKNSLSTSHISATCHQYLDAMDQVVRRMREEREKMEEIEKRLEQEREEERKRDRLRKYNQSSSSSSSQPEVSNSSPGVSVQLASTPTHAGALSPTSPSSTANYLQVLAQEREKKALVNKMQHLEMAVQALLANQSQAKADDESAANNNNTSSNSLNNLSSSITASLTSTLNSLTSQLSAKLGDMRREHSVLEGEIRQLREELQLRDDDRMQSASVAQALQAQIKQLSHQLSTLNTPSARAQERYRQIEPRVRAAKERIDEMAKVLRQQQEAKAMFLSEFSSSSSKTSSSIHSLHRDVQTLKTRLRFYTDNIGGELDRAEARARAMEDWMTQWRDDIEKQIKVMENINNNSHSSFVKLHTLSRSMESPPSLSMLLSQVNEERARMANELDRLYKEQAKKKQEFERQRREQSKSVVDDEDAAKDWDEDEQGLHVSPLSIEFERLHQENANERDEWRHDDEKEKQQNAAKHARRSLTSSPTPRTSSPIRPTPPSRPLTSNSMFSPRSATPHYASPIIHRAQSAIPTSSPSTRAVHNALSAREASLALLAERLNLDVLPVKQNDLGSNKPFSRSFSPPPVNNSPRHQDGRMKLSVLLPKNHHDIINVTSPASLHSPPSPSHSLSNPFTTISPPRTSPPYFHRAPEEFNMHPRPQKMYNRVRDLEEQRRRQRKK